MATTRIADYLDGLSPNRKNLYFAGGVFLMYGRPVLVRSINDNNEVSVFTDDSGTLSAAPPEDIEIWRPEPGMYYCNSGAVRLSYPAPRVAMKGLATDTVILRTLGRTKYPDIRSLRFWKSLQDNKPVEYTRARVQLLSKHVALLLKSRRPKEEIVYIREKELILADGTALVPKALEALTTELHEVGLQYEIV